MHIFRNHFKMAISCVWEERKNNLNLPVFTGRIKNSCCSAGLRFTLDFIIHRNIIKTIASEIKQKRMHSAAAHSQTRIISVLFASKHGRIFSSFFLPLARSAISRSSLYLNSSVRYVYVNVSQTRVHGQCTRMGTMLFVCAERKRTSKTRALWRICHLTGVRCLSM